MMSPSVDVCLCTAIIYIQFPAIPGNWINKYGAWLYNYALHASLTLSLHTPYQYLHHSKIIGELIEEAILFSKYPYTAISPLLWYLTGCELYNWGEPERAPH